MEYAAGPSSLQSQNVLEHYAPRRDLPTLSNSNPLGRREKYTIIDREPGDDCIPRYILRPNSSPSETEVQPLLRVSIFDIDDFVSAMEIQRFENLWYEHRNLDFSSKKDQRKTIERAKMNGAYVFKKSPHVQVIVYQDEKHVARLPTLENSVQQVSSVAEGIATTKRTSILRDNDMDSHGHEPTIMADPEEYEVSGVIDHKEVLGMLYYLVTWEGYPENDATWLTSEELTNSTEAIDDYFKGITDNASAEASRTSSSEWNEIQHPDSVFPRLSHLAALLQTILKTTNSLELTIEKLNSICAWDDCYSESSTFHSALHILREFLEN